MNQGLVATLFRKVITVFRYLLAHPEQAFLLIVLVFGPLLVILVPPFSGYDEANHYYRAYQVSEGGFIAEEGTRDNRPVAGGKIPSSLGIAVYDLAVMNPHQGDKYASIETAAISKGLNQKLEPSNKMFLEFSNSALYSPVAYTPYALTAKVARAFNTSPLAMHYLMRLVGFAAFALCIYFAVKLLPRGRWFMALVSLFPSTLFQAATISTDGLTFGISFLTIALITRYALSTRALTNQQIGYLFVLFITLALLKPPYSLLVLLLPALWPKITGTARRILAFPALFLAATVPQALWLSTVQAINFPYRNIAFNLNLNIDSQSQIAWILSHPVSYFVAIIRSFSHINYLPVSVTKPDFLPGIVAVLFFVTLLLLLLRQPGIKKPSVSNVQALLFFGVFVVGCFVLFTSIYVTWEPVGSALLDDFRSRYLIPLLPLMAIGLSRLPIKLVDPNNLVGKLALIMAVLSPLFIINYFVFP